MDIKDMEVGLHVRISNDISKTHLLYSSDLTMKNMRGKVYKIERIKKNRVIIKGYMWAPEDILEIEEENNILPIFHYTLNKSTGV